MSEKAKVKTCYEVITFNHPSSDRDLSVRVCDDCYQDIHPHKHPDKVAATALEAIARKG